MSSKQEREYFNRVIQHMGNKLQFHAKKRPDLIKDVTRSPEHTYFSVLALRRNGEPPC